MPNPTAPTAAPKPPPIATVPGPTRLAPAPKPPRPGPTPEEHEANLHTAVAAARDNPDAHTLTEVEGHVAPLHDMDAPTAIKVAARVTGQPNLRRKSQAIDAVRGALAPNRFDPSLAWGGIEEHSALSHKDAPPNWSGVGSRIAPQPRDKNRDAAAFVPAPIHNPNVEETDEDGVTKEARVGVPGNEVPGKIKRVPNLTREERAHETQFRNYYESDPVAAGSEYRHQVLKKTKPGEPPSFETDDAKNAHKDWRTAGSLDERAKNRAALNIPLHATANAIAKQAFLQHLDTLKEGDKVLVTNGGCGAGKGYSFEKDEKTGLPNNPEAYALKQQAKAVWDSAGDQNATENKWIKKELDKRGLKGIYTYVHVDPKQSWANPKRGIVQRAANIKNGRMISGKVFADSYALGAKNMHAFHQANKDDPNSEFMFLDNTGEKPKLMSGVHPDDLKLDRHELAKWAHQVIHERPTIAEHIKQAATADARHWSAGS